MSGASGAKRWKMNTDAVLGAENGAPAPEGIGDREGEGQTFLYCSKDNGKGKNEYEKQNCAGKEGALVLSLRVCFRITHFDSILFLHMHIIM